MWSAIKTSVLQLFGVPQTRSEFLRLARERGFLSENELERATRLLEEDEMHRTSQDLLVEEGLLTDKQAEIVCLARKTEAPEEHLDEQVRLARTAISNTGALHLSQVASALAKKK